jgi:hypothetical protein
MLFATLAGLLGVVVGDRLLYLLLFFFFFADPIDSFLRYLLGQTGQAKGW